MAQCIMKLPNGNTCNKIIFKCKQCSQVGCQNRDCRNQCFDYGRCVRCGATNALN